MSDNTELHGRLMGFLMGEFARKDLRQCVRVDLLYSPGQGWKDEDIRRWVRADQPELFDNMANVEQLVSQVIEIAMGEADSKAAGKHRFVLKTLQHSNDRAQQSFSFSPTYHGGDEMALVANGGGGGGGGGRSGDTAAVITNHAGQLMRINAQMFDSALRPLAQQNSTLLAELITTREENRTLQRELDVARSNKDEREFQMYQAAQKDARTTAGFNTLLQIGSVVAAKIGGGDDAAGAGSPLMMLASKFGDSLRSDQINVLQSKAIPIFMSALDMGQKMMFMELMKMFTEGMNTGTAEGGPPRPSPGAGLPPGANGAPAS